MRPSQAEPEADDVIDLATRRACFDGRHDRRHEIGGPTRGGDDRLERRVPFRLTAIGSHRSHAFNLPAFDIRIEAEYVRRGHRFVRKLVDANHDRFARIDRSGGQLRAFQEIGGAAGSHNRSGT